MPGEALAVKSLSKRFGGQLALNSVDLSVAEGEIHGLLGENGSGKSTLIKILAGYHAPDGGEVEIFGERVGLPLQPGEAGNLGLEFVHQDLGLIPSLSVVENLLLRDLARPSLGAFISWKAAERRAREVFARYEVELDPTHHVATLTPVQRALLAIVRAVEGLRATSGSGDRKGIVILDEPTVFLPKADTDKLFALLRGIANRGSSVLFVSHDLDEVLEVTDRVTVLRDGKVVGTAVSREVTKQKLVEMIIGRRLDAVVHSKIDTAAGSAGASVRGLRGKVLSDIDLDIRAGEVLGVTGLVGSGFEELPYLMYGAQPAEAGTLEIGGEVDDLTRITPDAALKRGIALLPADRRRDGSIGSLSITDNITLPTLQTFMVGGMLRRQQMSRRARELMDSFDVRPRNPELQYGLLSGGNQQRALLAKWLQVGPRLILLHEPTQGVDVGAREQIFSIIRRTSGEGAMVVCASSDYEQLAIICDRVVVIARGRIVSELTGASITKETITEQCLNSLSSSAA